MDDDDDIFYGELFEGLGDTWSAILGESGKFSEHLPTIRQEGTLRDGAAVHHPGIGHVVMLQEYPDAGPLRAGVLSVVTETDGEVSASLRSAYPVMDGLPNRVRIKGRHTWENGLEGIVSAHKPEGPAITFFNPYYYREADAFAAGAELDVCLAGLAFSLNKAEDHSFPVTDGEMYRAALERFLADNPDKTERDFTPPVLSTRGARILFPAGYVPEWTIQCQVEAVESFSFLDEAFIRMQTVFAGTDELELRGYLYARASLLGGYTPQAGDDITALAWMSGHRQRD